MNADDCEPIIGAGLCGLCAHAIVRPTRRGSTYLRCGLAQADERFARYPRLPMLACAGFADRGTTSAR